MRPIGIGVLGTADIARRRMLPAMVASPEFHLAAVASRDRGTASDVTARFGGRAVHGYAALLERSDVQAVYIPLPAALHAEWVAAALHAGKHVLAEKPLSTDAARTGELLALARSRGLALWENVMFIHHSQHLAVAKLVASGAIGELREFHAAFTIPRRPAGDIRYRADLGGGALWDTGVYPVRAALHLLGPDLRVAGAVLTRGPGFEVDTAGAALLRRADGVTAQLAFGLDHAYRCEYQLGGSIGRISLASAFTPAADHRPVLRVERPAGVEEIRLDPDDQVANALGAFSAAVRADPPSTDPASAAQATLLTEIRRCGRAPTKIPLTGEISEDPRKSHR